MTLFSPCVEPRRWWQGLIAFGTSTRNKLVHTHLLYSNYQGGQLWDILHKLSRWRSTAQLTQWTTRSARRSHWNRFLACNRPFWKRGHSPPEIQAGLKTALPSLSSLYTSKPRGRGGSPRKIHSECFRRHVTWVSPPG